MVSLFFWIFLLLKHSLFKKFSESKMSSSKTNRSHGVLYSNLYFYQKNPGKDFQLLQGYVSLIDYASSEFLTLCFMHISGPHYKELRREPLHYDRNHPSWVAWTKFKNSPLTLLMVDRPNSLIRADFNQRNSRRIGTRTCTNSSCTADMDDSF